MCGSIADEIDVCDDVSVFELALAVLADELGEADHGVERRPQLIAHVGDEFGFDLIGELGLDLRRIHSQLGLVAQHRAGEQR
jgi:hypothetical protein